MIKETFELLGQRARDKVSQFEGIIWSVCFDLYGCVQAVVVPKVKDDGALNKSLGFDVARLVPTGERPFDAPSCDPGLLEFLGHRGRDRLTGFEGVIASIAYEANGMVLACLSPTAKRDGTLGANVLIEVERIEKISNERVMDPPNFGEVTAQKPEEALVPATYSHGPAEKPWLD